MKKLGRSRRLFAGVCCASMMVLASASGATPQEQTNPPKPDALTVKQHAVPKNTHPKSKTFTDDWTATQGGKGHKGKGTPDNWEGGQSAGGKSNSGTFKDRWEGTGNGKTGKTHQDDWMATDVKSRKTTPRQHPKTQAHIITRNPK